MIPLDILLTAVIVAAAAVWAGRGIWRAFRRRARGSAAASACGGPAGGCGNCPTGPPEASPHDADPCGEGRPHES